jgi:hypothetical protein
MQLLRPPARGYFFTKKLSEPDQLHALGGFPTRLLFEFLGQTAQFIRNKRVGVVVGATAAVFGLAQEILLGGHFALLARWALRFAPDNA